VWLGAKLKSKNIDSCAALFLEKTIAKAARKVSFAEIASQII
jgi:hypothetical protein